jgi:hypothetical protein
MTTTELKQNLDHQLAELLDGLQALRPADGSLEWYLINQVKMLMSAIENAQSKQDLQNGVGVFSRFCTESMDWDTDLYRRCTEVTALGFKLAKK